jgi:AraC family transcriptional regulator
MRMNALNQTQQVIDMLERDIFNTDFEKVSRLTGIPQGVYQRIFSYICGISMAEYVRRRKLTVSAQMLLAGEINVTDAAFECGYENSTSFSRAFKEQFSVPPVHITAEILKDKAFSPLSFAENDTYYIVKGRRIMAELLKIEYENLNNAYLLISDMAPKNGYELDYEDFYWIEFYTVSRFCTAVENGAGQVICDWIMPCKKL